MARHRRGPLIDSGNRTDNPLRPYRMGMLQHGFVDESGRPGMKPDENTSMSYGIVRFRNGRFPTAAVVTILGIAAVIAVVTAIVK